MNIKNLSKLPKRKVTVDEILGIDDIAEIALSINDDKTDISDIIVITMKDDKISWQTNCMLLSRKIYLLEVVKKALLDDE